MSSFNLTKKLQSAKRAWKSFTDSLQSKLHKFKICKSVKTTKSHCFNTLHTIRSSIWRKLHALMRRSGTRPRLYHSHQNLHYHHLQGSNAATVYIDELFPKRRHDVMSSSDVSKAAKTEMTTMNGTVEKKQQHDQHVATSGVKILDGNNDGQSSESHAVGNDKWKLPMLPQFRGIDERAEEFISKFRQEMKLQREQSILDFEERLARSA